MNIKSSKPEHIVIIMDGNGRWAEKNDLPRAKGHKSGVKTLRNLIERAVQLELTMITVYAFSRENWQRPRKEVDLLIDLFITSLQSEVHDLHKNNIKLNFIGELTKFSDILRKSMKESELLTYNNSGLTLNVALNYSGRWDIHRALLSIINEVQSKKITIDEVNEKLINSKLSLAENHEPDLFIRTGGEKRISNYLLWQLAYTEIFFEKKLWPEFSTQDYNRILVQFKHLKRNFGNIK